MRSLAKAFAARKQNMTSLPLLAGRTIVACMFKWRLNSYAITLFHAIYDQNGAYQSALL